MSLEATAIQAAASAAPAVLPGFVKYATYPFKVEENIKALESAVDGLAAMEKDVLTVRTRTMRNPKFPTSTVDGWLDKVNKVKNEAKHIIEQYQHRIRFIHKLGPDYIISRNAEKILPDVRNLCSNQIINNLISHAQALIPRSPGVNFNFSTKSGREFEISVHRKKK